MKNKYEVIENCPLCLAFWKTYDALQDMYKLLKERRDENDLAREVYLECREVLSSVRKDAGVMLKEHPRCASCGILLGRGHGETWVAIGDKLYCESCARSAVVFED